MKTEEKCQILLLFATVGTFQTKSAGKNEGNKVYLIQKSKEKDTSNMHFEGRNVKILEVMECHRHALQDLPTYTSAFPKLASALRGF